MTQFKHPEDVLLVRILGEELDCAFFIKTTLRPWCHKHDKNPRQSGIPICPDFKYKRK